MYSKISFHVKIFKSKISFYIKISNFKKSTDIVIYNQTSKQISFHVKILKIIFKTEFLKVKFHFI